MARAGCGARVGHIGPPARCGPLVSVQCASLFIFPSLPPHYPAPLRLSLTSGKPQPLAVVRALHGAFHALVQPCNMSYAAEHGMQGARWLGSMWLGNHGLARLGCGGRDAGAGPSSGCRSQQRPHARMAEGRRAASLASSGPAAGSAGRSSLVPRSQPSCAPWLPPPERQGAGVNPRPGPAPPWAARACRPDTQWMQKAAWCTTKPARAGRRAWRRP